MSDCCIRPAPLPKLTLPAAHSAAAGPTKLSSAASRLASKALHRLRSLACVLAGAGLLTVAAHAQPSKPASPTTAVPTKSSAATVPANSALDDRLLYQLLIAEMALNSGETSSAYELILDAARRTKDDALFRRAVDIALQSRAGDQALAATRAWRAASPKSMDALRLQLQILVLLNRHGSVAEPLKQLLAQTPAAELPDLISALPRLLQRSSDSRGLAQTLEDVLKPYRSGTGATAIASRTAQGRAWLEARDFDRALALTSEAQALDASAPGPALLALELMREKPESEKLVKAYLAQSKAEASLRMTYVRVLTAAQRYADAIAQLSQMTRQQPDVAAAFLSLGALHLELNQAAAGEAALLRYVELAEKQVPSQTTGAAKVAAAAANADEDDGDADTEAPRPEQGLLQAWLMLAHSAEQRGDFSAAEKWLAQVKDPQRALEVQTRRASILARQGQLAQGLQLIRSVPERRADDARAKLVAEAALLRVGKRWGDAFATLRAAAERFPNDSDLLYEQAMMAEKLDRLDEMEVLLRRVIAIKPDNAHAYNALGYSLADRKLRLPEARELIKRALELAPGDPFITDSLGWVEYRLGNGEEAIRLLRSAYAARPDTEIAAHLGEVLWSAGMRDEARRIWGEARIRDASNDVLRETLARLRIDL